MISRHVRLICLIGRLALCERALSSVLRGMAVVVAVVVQHE